FPGLHFGIDRAAHEEGAAQVHAQDLVELREADVLELVADADAGIVDQHIDRAMFIPRRGNEFFHLSGVRYVAFVCKYRLGLGRNFGRRSIVADIAEGDLGAFPGKGGDDGRSDTGATAGDDDMPLLEFSIHAKSPNSWKST